MQSKKNKQPILNIENNTTEKDRILTGLPKQVDLSDIPELDFNGLGKPIIGKFYQP